MTNNENRLSVSDLATMDTSARADKQTLKPIADSDCRLIEQENIRIESHNDRAFVFDARYCDKEEGRYQMIPYLSVPDNLSDEQVLEIIHDLNRAYRRGYEDGLIAKALEFKEKLRQLGESGLMKGFEDLNFFGKPFKCD
jgi:hypothetical protein